jgi:hypothetical protein
MRTSFDFPDPLFRHLKSRAALEGSSLRDLVVALVERGLAAPEVPPAPKVPAGLPSVSLGAPMALPAKALTNARLAGFLDD